MLGTIAQIAKIGFLVTATAALGWFLWTRLDGEPRRELDPHRRILAARVVEEIARELPRRDEVRRLAVLPVVSDLDGRVYDLLYDAIADADLYFLVSPSAVREATEAKTGRVAPLTKAEAVAVGRALKEKDASVEGVLFSTLTEMTEGRRGLGAHVKLEASLIELTHANEVPGGFVTASSRIDRKLSLDYYAGTMHGASALGRFLLGLLLIGGLPLALYVPVARRILRSRHNTANALLLGGMVLADVLIALALMGFQPGFLGGVVVFLAGLGGGIYDHDALEWLESRLG